MDLISIIVPIYNVENYLDKCVESIVNQTYNNLEIILVDDGSPDKCPEMCEYWAKRDERIVVIHKENGGLSDARNAGLRIAKGRYISFIDSDDWVHSTFIETLYNAIIDNSADMSACDVQLIYEDDIPQPVKDEPSFVICTPEQVFLDNNNKIKFRAVAWNKLYRADFLEGEFYPAGKFHEDEFFTYRIVDKANKLVYVDSPLYYYLQRDNSIMTTASIKHLDALDAYLERLEYFKKYPLVYRNEKIMICFTCIKLYQNIKFLDKSIKGEYISRIKNSRSKLSFTLKEVFSYDLKGILFIIGSKYFISILARYFNYREKSNNI